MTAHRRLPGSPGSTIRLAAVVMSLLAATAAAAEPPRVVASIKPIHSLAAAVMRGVGVPELLVQGAASPHSFSMRPSDAARLNDAAVVFWIGPALETFLVKPVTSLAGGATVLELEEVPGLAVLAPREGGVWAAHEDDEETPATDGSDDGLGGDHGHAAGTIDAHIWLDPGNAKVIAAAMAETLAAADPDRGAAYRANAADLAARIDALDAELAAMLAPVKDRPFIVFHDAYQYFEAHYRLAAAGSITVSPDQPPGARRLSEIRATIAARGAVCVFREPQVKPALVELVIEGGAARPGELDPEAASLSAGPELYFEMMRALARNLADCLGKAG